MKSAQKLMCFLHIRFFCAPFPNGIFKSVDEGSRDTFDFGPGHLKTSRAVLPLSGPMSPLRRHWFFSL